MEKYIVDNIENVVCPALQELEEDVAEIANRTAAHGAVRAMNCGFLAGIHYATALFEKGKGVEDTDNMKAMMLDIFEKAME